MSLIQLDPEPIYRLALYPRAGRFAAYEKDSGRAEPGAVDVNGYWLYADIYFSHKIEKALVDTGSWVSIFPLDVWEKAPVMEIDLDDPTAMYYLSCVRGINEEVPTIPCKFGYVSCDFLDQESNVFVRKDIPALLCLDRSAVKVTTLGFMGFLEESELSINLRANICQLNI